MICTMLHGAIWPSVPCTLQLNIDDMTNEDGLRTMVTNKRLARELHMVRKRR